MVEIFNYDDVIFFVVYVILCCWCFVGVWCIVLICNRLLVLDVFLFGFWMFLEEGNNLLIWNFFYKMFYNCGGIGVVLSWYMLFFF